MSTKPKKKEIRVIDLFAGVGGFRVGLDRAGGKNGKYTTIWSNQWEPSTKTQHASQVYINNFGPEGHSNVDIAIEVKNDNVPHHDLLVGGFPCQDYSVARTLSQAAGIIGKKGVLWWEIYKILEKKIECNKPTKYLFLENVDRLLKSPAKQRGRDFAIILGSLNQLGYAVEWRVINAAEYGFPQRRRRVYILGYKKNTKPYLNMKKLLRAKNGHMEWLTKKGVMANAFKVKPPVSSFVSWELTSDIKAISDNFDVEKDNFPGRFENTGMMIDGIYHTIRTEPDHTEIKKTLADIVLPISDVEDCYHVNKDSLRRWNYLKGPKCVERKSKSGHLFKYSEGGMVFPDPLDKPSRTIVTGEGGPTPSRFKHVIEQDGVLRRLTPVELERLCGFDDNHTAGHTPAKRAFFMGNALVVGVIERIGKELLKNI
jgi:DNA (cytosine-5)-methyltransferase 1